MKESVQVSMARDVGHKQVWGLSWLYKIDVRKTSIDSKKLLWATIFVFFFASIISLFGILSQPETEKAAPEILEPTSLSSRQVALPELNHANEYASHNQSQSRSSKKQVIKYSGPQATARPGGTGIPPGSLIKAKLITGASNGALRAEVTEPFEFQGDMLIEKGSVLLGNGSSTDVRLNITFNRMVLEDGSVQTIRAYAVDSSDQTVGLKGSKLGHTALKFAGSIGLHFVAGIGEGLQEKEVKDGVAVKKADFRNALLNGATRASLELSKETMEALKNREHVIYVKKGTPILILFGAVN